MAEFSGKRIVITGGAGGIGVETARTMLAHGAHVVLVDIDVDRLANARETLGTARVATWQSAIDTRNRALRHWIPPVHRLPR